MSRALPYRCRLSRCRPSALALAIGICLLAGQARTARAQDAPPFADEPRFDAAGMLGWQLVRVDTGEIGGRLPREAWDHRFLYGGLLGYYWTPHLKAEIEVGGTTTSRFDSYREVRVPGQSFPSFVWTNHRASEASVGGRLLYQFGENAWFHPFAGVGVMGVRTRERAETPRQTTFVSGGPGQPSQEIVITEGESSSRVTREVQPLLVAGFKAYANARAFFRADAIWGIPRQGESRRISWRAGVGVDF